MRKLKVLIVEDEESVSSLITHAIEEVCIKQGCNVVIDVTDGSVDVCKMQKDIKYDLIIMDLVLPYGGMGMQFIKGLREFDKVVEFIIITGFPTMETAVEAISLDVWYYFIKPFDPFLLVEQAHRAIEHSVLKTKILELSKLATKTYT